MKQVHLTLFLLCFDDFTLYHGVVVFDGALHGCEGCGNLSWRGCERRWRASRGQRPKRDAELSPFLSRSKSAVSEFVCLVPRVYSEFIVQVQSCTKPNAVCTTSVSGPPIPPFPSVLPAASDARRDGQPWSHT